MHRVIYHKRARKALSRVPADRSKKILEAIERIAALDDPTGDLHVKMMSGDWIGAWVNIVSCSNWGRLRKGPKCCLFW